MWTQDETADDYQQTADTLKKVRDLLATFYSKHTKLSKAKALKLMSENTWLTAKESKEYGFSTKTEHLISVGNKIVASYKDKLIKNSRKMSRTRNAVALAKSVLGIPQNKTVLTVNQDELVFPDVDADDQIKVGD